MTHPRSDQLAAPIAVALRSYSAREQGRHRLADDLYWRVFEEVQAEGLSSNYAYAALRGAAAIREIIVTYGETDHDR